MEVTPFLIILTIFCQNAVAAKRNLQINRLIFDLTRPVNELLGGEISKHDFLSDVYAAFDLIGANVATSTIFYATAGNTTEELESRTDAACKIINETLNLSSDSQLLISWTYLKINGTTTETLNLSFPYHQTFNGCSPKLLIHFNDDNTCDDLPDLPDEKVKELLYSNNGVFVGVSYDELLLQCKSLKYWKQYAPMSVVNLKFGVTRGVLESFGLFQAIMKSFSERVNVNDPKITILYYPNPYSVGDDEHQNLLIQYACIWTNSNTTFGAMLLQVPNSIKKAEATSQFSIIPRFTRSSPAIHVPDKVDFLSFLMFAASFKSHQIIFVDEYFWESWNSLPEDITETLKIGREELLIDVVMDCGDWSCYEMNATFHEQRRLNAGETTIVIGIGAEPLLVLPPEIAKRISPKSTIACKYTFENPALNVEQVVNACQSINGSVYVLRIGLNPNEDFDYLRSYLDAVNWFRKAILAYVPFAKVYLDLVLDLYSIGMFCDELAPVPNLNFEALFNWAKVENFPIIQYIYIEYATSYFPQWFTLLRRLNYPYPDWANKSSSKGKLQSCSVSNPAFLMEDYQKSIHNWEPDACIHRTDKRWELNDDFFHNHRIGTTFQLKSIFSNRTTTENDYITMLHFIFYRFRLVEIEISFDFSNLFAAIDRIMTSEILNAEIFMNYVMKEQDTENDWPEVTSFFSQLKQSKIYQVGWLKGVHVELVEDTGTLDGENASNSSYFEPVLRLMRVAKLSTLACGIELPSVKICHQMLEKFIFTQPKAGLIGSVDYIICKERYKDLTWESDKLKLQTMLDSHLALKRTLNQMVPHLRIYFRVTYDFQIASWERYISFLALLNTFGTKYDITYFIVDAFDDQLMNAKTGWWGITNYSDLSNPRSYFEKLTAIRGQPMWYPQDPTLLNSTTSSSSSVSNNQDFQLTIIVSSVGSTVLLILVILVICFGLRYRKLQHLSRFLLDSEVREFLHGRVSTHTGPTSTEMELMESVERLKFNQDYKLDLPDLIIDFEKILGSGAFGTVYKGMTKNIPAAIKRPKGDCSKSTFKNILTEVKVLSYVGNHPNVVAFLGAYVDEIYKGVLYISTELCTLGSLESFLRKKNKVISQRVSNQDQINESETSVLHFDDLNTFALDIAKGMAYIESRCVVHGDLSTRNVLLDENLVCKIGDFGLSRKLYEYQMYVKSSQEPLPWKWMAPESLTKMEFTSKTDLWSYGVTLWEIYSLGNIPYSGLNWTADFANELRNGLRLPSPDFATPTIYAKLMECWDLNPDERPTFTDMITFFSGLREDVYMILNSTEKQAESTVE